MIDADRVRARLVLLSSYQQRLRSLSRLPLDDYVANHDLEGRYAVQVAAQICIDLANHVIASHGWATATDFRDAFTRLDEHGVIDSALATRLRALAGQRNLLVHLYAAVDDGLIHAYLQEGLDDLDDFAAAIAAAAEADDS